MQDSTVGLPQEVLEFWFRARLGFSGRLEGGGVSRAFWGLWLLALEGFLLEAVGLPCDQAGTHSLRTTLLTWASRAMSVSFTENERLHLGHHSAPDTKSMVVFRREAYSRLYAKVVAMFRTIADGAFNPDLPPAERVEHMADSPEGGFETERYWLERLASHHGLSGATQTFQYPLVKE